MAIYTPPDFKELYEGQLEVNKQLREANVVLTMALRDQFAMHALTGLQSHEDDRTYNRRHIHNPEYAALSLDEWRSLLRKQDAELCYAMADAMLEARAK